MDVCKKIRWVTSPPPPSRVTHTQAIGIPFSFINTDGERVDIVNDHRSISLQEGVSANSLSVGAISMAGKLMHDRTLRKLALFSQSVSLWFKSELMAPFQLMENKGNPCLTLPDLHILQIARTQNEKQIDLYFNLWLTLPVHQLYAFP